MDKLKKFTIRLPSWSVGIQVDDFLVAIGKNKSNSVYHVAEVKSDPHKTKRLINYRVKVYVSDLITCLRRDSDQKLFTVVWDIRTKKKK